MGESALLQFATGWDQEWGVRLAAGLFGLAALGLTIRALAGKRCGLIAALLWIAAGGGALAFSLWPQSIVVFIISTPYLTRVRVIMGGISLLVLLITLESIRRSHLHERYALLWVATALVLFVAALFPHSVALLRAMTGMEYATALVALAFTFLVLVAFHFSISISASRSNQARIAQRVAILEERLRSLEEQAGHRPAGTGAARGAGRDETEGHPT